MDGPRVACGVRVTIRRVTGSARAAGSGVAEATKWFITQPASGYVTQATSTFTAQGPGPYVVTMGAGGTSSNIFHLVNPNGRSGGSFSYAALVVGSVRNVNIRYMAGSFVTAGHYTIVDGYLYTSRVGTDGSIIWAKRSTASTNTAAGSVISMTTTNSGVLYLYSNGAVSALSLTDGSEQWALTGWNPSTVGYNFPAAIAVDGSDNLYFGSNQLNKVSAAGSWQWARTQADAGEYKQLAASSTGNVATVGTSTTPASNWVVSLINTSGTLQWSRSLGTATGSGVRFDSAGNVYTVGLTGSTVYVAKYDSSGTLQFQRSLAITASSAITAASIGLMSIDTSDRLWFHVTFTHSATSKGLVFRIPTSVPTGTYTVGEFTVTVATSSLTTGSPTLALTTASPTTSSTSLIGAEGFAIMSPVSSVAQTATYRSGVI